MAVIPDFFGLNLGHFSIKLTEIKRVNNKAALEAIGSTPTSVGLLNNDSANGIKTLAAEINKACKNAAIKSRNCVMSVPESAVFSRLITLPKVSEKEVGEAIQWALKPLVPMSLDEVNVSFLEIDQKVVDSNTFSNWYVVAAPKDLIKRYQESMEIAGVNLLAVETESLALTRMVVYNYPQFAKKDIMIVDMGAESTNVILSRNGIVMFSQTISTGSNAITKVIASDLGVDMVQAEKYKITYGLDATQVEGKIAKSVEPILQIISSEILRTLAYYNEKIGGTGISEIFICGGGADLLKFNEYLHAKLNIGVINSNPVVNFEQDPTLAQKLQNIHLSSFNVSIGLSLKGLL
jgi:type IV pilus assembly protein PilM